ncbi:MAG: TIGR04295 family B12-binding domain-containing radical SAM protein [Acidobacteriota bacterium]|nr:TIGR04295 family B12-binding domain-containing radical SAM protein [Acidobacteriota bacterium]
MKYLLLNPNWTFDGSIYFGCREPHLPLEYGYSKALLEREGHEARIVDGQIENLSREEIRERVADFHADFLVVTTAPSYLFWRCAPPELRVPQQSLQDLTGLARQTIAVGPHASTTPAATLRKLGVDVVVMGECEEILPRFARAQPVVQTTSHASDMAALPALAWPDEIVAKHKHHHHRFDAPPTGPGAEMETSRGCPYHCTFCAKDNFRNLFRRRPLAVVLEELDRLLAQDVEYIYFIDEIFLPNRELLEAFAAREFKFGVQTRIDLWNEPMLDLLGRAGCVSIEAGVESITEEGRDLLDKKCKMSTEGLAQRLIYAKSRVPFVQANLLESRYDDPAELTAWRDHLRASGVWANEPVPLFPYPGSPDYTRRWGAPDDRAWERAHEFYLNSFAQFSDVQEQQPMPLCQIEL